MSSPELIEEVTHRKKLILTRLFGAIHAHPFWGSLLLLIYAGAVTLPHEQVQWQCSMIALRTTHAGLYHISAEIALAETVLLTAYVGWRLFREPQRWFVVGLWALTLALIIGARSSLTANDLELVHYPQYFPEGVLLMALTLSPIESLSWVMVFACLDEGYQYWVLSKGRPTVFDFNDLYMDLLGGAIGVAFAMAFLYCRRRCPERGDWRQMLKRRGVVVLLSMLASGVVLWASGLMLVTEDKANTHYWFALGRFHAPAFWSQIVWNGPNRYHTLTPLEGIVLIFGTMALYATLFRRYRCATS